MITMKIYHCDVDLSFSFSPAEADIGAELGKTYNKSISNLIYKSLVTHLVTNKYMQLELFTGDCPSIS